MLDQDLARELDAWLTAHPADGLALARLVTRRIRRAGRHDLPTPILEALAAIAARHRGRDPYLDDYLDAVLTPHELALPLLGRVGDGAGLDPEHLAALLLADVVRHERRHPDPVDPAAGRRRARRAARFVWTVDLSLDADEAPPDVPALAWLEHTVLPTSARRDEHLVVRARQAQHLVAARPPLVDLLHHLAGGAAVTDLAAHRARRSARARADVAA
ncbi:hypothetical protein PHK61_13700 [Actinomycetospora lutea]|uniref:hypothetical protein n=1 Tax=Actinomycetospora lutea TaxID=663604 RepID=UPI002365C82C|nr:hypothetical protein [Actinomycetospora lutea]MDD7939474.1 hypothetical protein [Actinomycetospora lutea]